MAASFSASLYFLASLSAYSFFLRDLFSSVLTLIFPSIIASSLAALLSSFFLYLAFALLSRSLAPLLLLSSDLSKSSKLPLMNLTLQ